MQTIKIDFDNPGLPQRLDVVENDAQSRFFKAVLYKDGKAYTAPDGATYSIMYRGFGPQNEGWYDTINDGAGKRAACSVSGNVVTCEIARQALRVPGHVGVVLCMTGSNGYMLHGWPIDCNCRNDSYTSGTSVESFFYITQVTNANWTSAIQTWEELKNMIDPTLSVSGKAADAAKVGEAVGQVKEDKINKPKESDNNKIARAKNGDVEWVDVGQPTDEQTDEAVTKWLDKHPEATTTVQDGAIGEKKIEESFLQWIKKDYVTPEMFGAVGDGEHDDTEAVNRALHYNNVIFANKYLITTIKITNDVTLCGINSGKIISNQEKCIIASGSNVAIKNIEINSITKNISGNPIADFDSCNLVEIANCKINIQNYKGFLFENCTNVKFKDNLVIYNGSAIEYYQSNGEISSNLFDYVNSDSMDYHCIDIRINNAKMYNVDIHDNNIRSYANTIQLSSRSGANVRFVDIHDNLLYSKKENAVKFDGVKNGSFRNNTIDYCVYAIGTLGLNGITKNITISNNRILDGEFLVRDIFCKYSYDGSENYHWTEGDLRFENNYISNVKNLFALGADPDDLRTEKLNIIFEHNTVVLCRGRVFYVRNANTSKIRNSNIIFHNNTMDVEEVGNFLNTVWKDTSIHFIGNHINQSSSVLNLLCDSEGVFSDNTIKSDILASCRVIGKKITKYTGNKLITGRENEGTLIYVSLDLTVVPEYVFATLNITEYNGSVFLTPIKPTAKPKTTKLYKITYDEVLDN